MLEQKLIEAFRVFGGTEISFRVGVQCYCFIRSLTEGRTIVGSGTSLKDALQDATERYAAARPLPAACGG